MHYESQLEYFHLHFAIISSVHFENYFVIAYRNCSSIHGRYKAAIISAIRSLLISEGRGSTFNLVM